MISSIMEVVVVTQGVLLDYERVKLGLRGLGFRFILSWYIDHSPTALDFATSLFLLFASLEMAPRGRKPSRPHSVKPSCSESCH
jgi:hypothetical protein